MKKILIKIYFYLGLAGFDAIRFFSFLRGIGFFLSDHKKLKKQLKGNKEFPFGRLYPVLFDKYDKSGIMNGHYFHTDLLISSKIFKNNPNKHIDIGSRIDGFVAQVASYREIEIFDIRPIESVVKNIKFKQADLTQLPENMIACCDSISSLHAIEHFGLGRYGDTIDVDGHLKAISNIYSILKPGGKFYFATPIGKQRIEFNAHRVFSVQYLLNVFKNKFIINEFSYVDDKGDLFENIPLNNKDVEVNFNCTYGCGIFEMTKI